MVLYCNRANAINLSFDKIINIWNFRLEFLTKPKDHKLYTFLVYIKYCIIYLLKNKNCQKFRYINLIKIKEALKNKNILLPILKKTELYTGIFDKTHKIYKL